MIVTGSGRGFCAGLDLIDASSGSGIGSQNGPGFPPTLDLRDAPPTVLHAMDKPTLCALNGGAAGYGMDIALGCDIRIAAESAKLAPPSPRGVRPRAALHTGCCRACRWAKASEIISRSTLRRPMPRAGLGTRGADELSEGDARVARNAANGDGGAASKR